MTSKSSAQFVLLLLICSFLFSLADIESIQSCCQLLEEPVPKAKANKKSTKALAAKIVSCVNATATSNLKTRLEHAAPYTRGAQGPSLAVTLVTRATAEVWEYGAYALLIQAVYAASHGYAMRPLYPDPPAEDYQYHRKLTLLLEALQAGGRTDGGEGVHTGLSDYVVWWDADAVPLDLQRRVESLAARHPQAHVLLSADAASVANTGVFIVRRSRWAIAFLQHWLSQRSLGHRTDQAGLAAALTSDSGDFGRAAVGRRLALLPTYELNSEPPALSKQRDSDPVLHLAAESAAYRVRTLTEAARTVCAAIPVTAGALSDDSIRSATSRVPRQLGLHQHRLLQLADEVYGAESRRALRALRRASKKAAPGRTSAPAADLSTVRAASSKYAYVLSCGRAKDEQQAPRPVETEESLQVRRSAYVEVRNFVQDRQRIVTSMEAWKVAKKAAADGDGDVDASALGLDTNEVAYYSQCVQEATATPPPGSAAANAFARAHGLADDDDYDDYDDDDDDDDDDAAGIFKISPSRSPGDRKAARQRAAAESVFDPETDEMLKYCTKTRLDEAMYSLPDQLKTAAELAFDLLTALSTQTEVSNAGESEEASAVSDFLEATIDSLERMVHSSQRHIVLEMKAGLHSELAERRLALATQSAVAPAVAQSLGSAARRHLQTSLKVFNDLHASGQADLRAFSHAESLYGAALCHHGSYTSGMKHFEKSIDITAKHMQDRMHVSLIPKYYNAAMCMHQASQPEGVVKLLRRVLAIAARADSDADAFEEYVRMARARIADASGSDVRTAEL